MRKWKHEKREADREKVREAMRHKYRIVKTGVESNELRGREEAEVAARVAAVHQRPADSRRPPPSLVHLESEEDFVAKLMAGNVSGAVSLVANRVAHSIWPTERIFLFRTRG